MTSVDLNQAYYSTDNWYIVPNPHNTLKRYKRYKSLLVHVCNNSTVQGRRADYKGEAIIRIRTRKNPSDIPCVFCATNPHRKLSAAWIMHNWGRMAK
jgi:hypothetical protein